VCVPRVKWGGKTERESGGMEHTIPSFPLSHSRALFVLSFSTFFHTLSFSSHFLFSAACLSLSLSLPLSIAQYEFTCLCPYQNCNKIAIDGVLKKKRKKYQARHRVGRQTNRFGGCALVVDKHPRRLLFFLCNHELSIKNVNWPGEPERALPLHFPSLFFYQLSRRLPVPGALNRFYNQPGFDHR
jgi:hypothetical protein